MDADRRPRPVGGLMNILLQQSASRRTTSRTAVGNHSPSDRLYRQSKPSGKTHAEDYIHALQSLDPSSPEVIAATNLSQKSHIHHALSRNSKTAGLSLVRQQQQGLKHNARLPPHPKAQIARTLSHAYTNAIHAFTHALTNRTASILAIHCDLVVDLFMCILYLYTISTSFPLPDAQPQWLFITRPRWQWIALVTGSFYHVLSFVIRLSMEQDLVRGLMDGYIILDAITVIPFIVSLGLTQGQNLWVPYFMRCWYIRYEVQKTLGVTLHVDSDKGSVIINPIRNQLIIVGVTVASVIYTMMCWFQWAEMMFAGTQYGVVDSWYFTMVTAATIGYGDISPSHWISRLIVIVLIFIVLALVPGLISELVETFSLNSETSKRYISNPRSTKSHVIIVGDFTNPNQVQDLLNGFIEPGSSITSSPHLVLIAERPATDAVKALLGLPLFKSWCTYLQGTPLNERDFDRMKSSTAAACFVISNRDSGDWFEEDQRRVLQSWAFHIHNPEVPLYAHVLLPETRGYIQFAQDVVCVDEMKQLIVGYNCLVPGVATLLLNLVVKVGEREALCKEGWEFEYEDGMKSRVFVWAINERFAGKKYEWVCWYLWKEFGIMLLGVKSGEEVEGNDRRVNVNPVGYEIRKGDFGYFVGQAEEELKAVDMMTEEEFQWSIQNRSDMDVDVGEVKIDVDGKVSVGDDRDRPSTPPRTVSALKPNAISPTPSSTTSSKQMNTRISRPSPSYTSLPVTPPPLCHTLIQPKRFPDVFLDSADHLENHTIILGSATHLFNFICTLRASHISPDDLSPILIIDTEEPASEEQDMMTQFPGVYYLVGDPRHRRTLLKANMLKAKSVVVMSKPQAGVGESACLDGRGVMAYHVVLQVLAEGGGVEGTKDPVGGGGDDNGEKDLGGVVGPVEQVEGMESQATLPDTSDPHDTNNQKAEGGKVIGVLGSTQPTLITPKIPIYIDLLDRKNIRFLHAIHCSSPMTDHLRSPVYASGRVVVSGLLDNLVVEGWRNEDVANLISILCGGEDRWNEKTERQNQHRTSQAITVVSVGEMFGDVDGKAITYGRVVEECLLRRGWVPLGVFRAAHEDRGNGLEVVVTNPVESLIVDEEDGVFVVGRGHCGR
ncbi:potassium channel, sub T, member 2 [Rhizophlyctis rosea]|uniref:Potassium channel, sub T, member 2 n=1 Tax=Rhizophlyctis rosea TaxID=64517 RepID=A0AAD5SBS0_9FUNG|nr:potassium channel, sub T, member 2 [Rhizophlyctis rosea]